MDPKVNGQLQKEWGWLVSVYMFLGGLAAGAYTLGAINSFRRGEIFDLSTTVALWIALPALAAGMLCLLADLGSPSRAMLAGKKPKTSWISRGEMIVTVFGLLALVHLILRQFVDAGPGPLTVVAVLGIAFALGTMAYTGMLLGAAKGIPFWRSGMIPMVFIVSALVTGQLALMLGVSIFGDASVAIMSRDAAILIAVEMLAVLFFLQAAHRQPDTHESAVRLRRQPMFFLGYLGVGRVVPLLLVLLTPRVGIIFGALLGLAGGLLLRHVVIVSGALPTWNMGGFQFRRIHRPKEPKPGIGMLPPQ
jgi:formate-dependent nitrite reductase membrane component NrfD